MKDERRAEKKDTLHHDLDAILTPGEPWIFSHHHTEPADAPMFRTDTHTHQVHVCLMDESMNWF